MLESHVFFIKLAVFGQLGVATDQKMTVIYYSVYRNHDLEQILLWPQHKFRWQVHQNKVLE